jgi:hypothetical protein
VPFRFSMSLRMAVVLPTPRKPVKI